MNAANRRIPLEVAIEYQMTADRVWGRLEPVLPDRKIDTAKIFRLVIYPPGTNKTERRRIRLAFLWPKLFDCAAIVTIISVMLAAIFSPAVMLVSPLLLLIFLAGMATVTALAGSPFRNCRIMHMSGRYRDMFLNQSSGVADSDFLLAIRDLEELDTNSSRTAADYEYRWGEIYKRAPDSGYIGHLPLTTTFFSILDRRRGGLVSDVTTSEKQQNPKNVAGKKPLPRAISIQQAMFHGVSANREWGRVEPPRWIPALALDQATYTLVIYPPGTNGTERRRIRAAREWGIGGWLVSAIPSLVIGILVGYSFPILVIVVPVATVVAYFGIRIFLRVIAGRSLRESHVVRMNVNPRTGDALNAPKFHDLLEALEELDSYGTLTTQTVYERRWARIYERTAKKEGL